MTGFDLAAFLRRHQDWIIDEWVRRLRTEVGERYAGRPVEELYGAVPESFELYRIIVIPLLAHETDLGQFRDHSQRINPTEVTTKVTHFQGRRSNNWDVNKSARRLRIPLSQVKRKIKEYSLKRPESTGWEPE
ncbi:MAG: hypothetical protein AB1896_10160 [Thermodesulfobacteriota bacterium]